MSPRGLALSLVALALAGGCNAVLGNDVGHLKGAAKACTLNSDCGGEDLCIFATCSIPCKADIDCDTGSRCLVTAKRAVCVVSTSAGCATDRDCPEGSECTDAACRTSCGPATLQCAKDQSCSDENVCVGSDPGHDPGATGLLDSGTHGGTGGSGGAPGGAPGGGGARSSGGSNGGGTVGSGGLSGAGGSLDSGGTAGAGAGGVTGTGGGGAGSGGVPPGSGGASSGGAPGSGGAGTGGATAVVPTVLPTVVGTCPTFPTTGVATDLMFNGQKFKVWSGAGTGGPLVIYWYATASNPSETATGIGTAALNQITAQGGVVAAMYTSVRTGTNTGNNVWYTGDFAYADEVVACAIQQKQIDKSHIHTMGFSAGGLQAGYMAYARSRYLASVVTYSGGVLFSPALQDSTNPPAVMCQHGAPGTDVVSIDFAVESAKFASDIKKKGGFSIDCNHGGGHSFPPAADIAASWKFMRDHPYKLRPEPYAGGLPVGIPTYCKIVLQ